MIKKIWNKAASILGGEESLKEFIIYVVFGALTTAVSFICFWFFFTLLGLELLLSNSISWVISVIFAFFTNKTFVFNNKSASNKDFIKALVLFFGARFLSFLIFDYAGLWAMVKLLHFNPYLAKLIDVILVIIFNYFASKLVIFKKK